MVFCNFYTTKNLQTTLLNLKLRVNSAIAPRRELGLGIETQHFLHCFSIGLAHIDLTSAINGN